MFSIQDGARTRGSQHHGDQLRELAVTENRRAAKLSNVELIQNLARCGQRLDEHSLLVADAGGDKMQIFNRERQVFRERSIVRHDSKDGPPRAVGLQSALAKIAHRPKSVSYAADINF